MQLFSKRNKMAGSRWYKINLCNERATIVFELSNETEKNENNIHRVIRIVFVQYIQKKQNLLHC